MAKQIQERLRRLSILLTINAAFLAQTFHGFAQTSSTVTLAWNRSSSAGVSGYRVYYGVSSRTYTNHVDAGSATNSTISGLKTGVNYYFSATDYTTNGIESGYSTEIMYTPSASSPPSISLSSPAGGSVFTEPANISLAASVVTNGHTISKVQFFSGSTLLAEDTAPPYSFAWNGVAAGSYSLTAQLVYDSSNTLASTPISVTVNPQPLSGLTFASTSGTISSPFTAANGFVSQTIASGVTNGGRAAYTFTVNSTGDYLISAIVNAPNTSANSFYVNVDAEPVDPTMSWDIPVTSGAASRTVAWRGNGTPDADQFVPKVFNLAQGTHQLIIRGEEANTQLGSITISPAVTLPSPWQAIDIGAVGITGSSSITNGAYSISGAGVLGGTSDSCRFLYQPMTSDGELRVRLNSVQDTGSSCRVGLLIRETLTPGARCSFLGISPDGTIRIQNRTTTSGSTTYASPSFGILPNIWLRLVRSGSIVHSYISRDGVNWTQVGSTLNTMATNIYFGFAVASGQAGVLNASSLSSATVIP
jgi:hypothetical protein